MDHPLVLTVPFLAMVVGIPLYFAMRSRGESRQHLARLVRQGFKATYTFDFSDTMVAVDAEQKQVAFVNLRLPVLPRAANPPQDGETMSVRSTGVVPFEDLEAITVDLSQGQPIQVGVRFSKPNWFNGKRNLRFLIQGDPRVVESMLAVWPSRAAIGTVVISDDPW